MIFKIYRQGSSSLSILLAISLFTMLLLTTQQWLNKQQQQATKIYQQYQAVLIAENQLAQQYLGLSCQHQITLNGTLFQIDCLNAQEILVRFPLGEFKLTPN